MRPFLHERLRVLAQLLESSSLVLAKYNRLDLDLQPALTGWLNDAVLAYRSLGLASNENRLLALQAQFVAAGQGTHPDTLERVTSHRRGLLRAVALRVLQLGTEQLRTEIARDERALADARSQLVPMVLATVQQHPALLRQRAAPGQEQIDHFWQTMLKIPSLSLAARQMSMQLSLPDLQLLLTETVRSARDRP